MTHNIGNVLAKTAPFNFEEMNWQIEALVSGNIFGLDKHMKKNASTSQFILRKPEDIDRLAEELSNFSTDQHSGHRFRTVLIELMTNALFYGARDEEGDQKHEWKRNFSLPAEEAVTITLSKDEEKLGVSVLDPGGKLDKQTVLYWLDRQITPGDDGLPQRHS